MTGDVPLWLKVAYTAMVAAIVRVYLVRYGPANFLWFSDLALLGTTLALWTESRLVASTLAVGVLLPELLWNVSFFARLLAGMRVSGLVDYMFDPAKPLYLRGLSLFHVVVPIVLVWLVRALGYDARALAAQTIVAWIVLPLVYALTDPADNINWVFGPGTSPQKTIPPPLYLGILMLFFPLCVYLPTHLVLRGMFGSR
jgi:hypothetical protein